jgi:hypothetical protein
VRQAAVVFLLIVGIILTPLAIIGAWTQLVLLNTDRFVDLADDLLEREDVRDAIGAKVAQQIVAQEPLAAPFEDTIADAVSDVAATEVFLESFRVSLADLHDQLEAEDDSLVLDLSAVIEPVRDDIAAVVPGVQIPGGVGSFTIASRDAQPILWNIVELADNLSIAAIIGVIVAFGLVVALSESRWRMLGISGVIIVLWSLFLVLGLPLIRNGVTNQIPDDAIRGGARGAWIVVTRSLQIEALVAALIGVVIAGVGFVLDFAGLRTQAARPSVPPATT